MLQRVKEVQESDLRMVGALARNIQRVIAVTQADIDAAAAQGKAWVVKPVVKVSDPLDNLRGGTQLVIKQNSILPGQNVMRVMYVGGQAVVVGPDVPPLSLPDAMEDGILSLIAFGGTEQRNLPDGYIQRQFIYMMDGSYLLTDIVPTYDCKVEMDFQTTSFTSYASFLGGRSQTNQGAGLNIGYLNNEWLVDGFTTGSRYNSGVAPATNTRYKFIFNNQVATLTSGNSTLFTNIFTGTESNGAALAINGFNNDGSVVNNNNGIYLYSFKVWNAQGVLVADYVPAIQKGTVPVVGFYDTVSGTFKTATAGTFAAGGEAVPTPDTPMDIVSNNGVLKASINEFDANAITNGYFYNENLEWIANASVYTTDYMKTVKGKYTLVLHKEDNITATVNVRVNLFDSNKIIQSQVVIPIASDATVFTFDVDIPSNISYVRVSTNPRYVTVESFNNSKPVYADGVVETINIHGKNLFDDSLLAGDTSTLVYTSFSVPNGTYTMSSPDYPFTAGITNVFFLAGNVSSGASSTTNGVASTHPITITVTDGYYTVAHRYDSVANPADPKDYNWQIEQGSTATTYEPYYDGGTATAEMLLSLGDYTDEQEIISGVVTRKLGVKVLDGTEDWGMGTSGRFRLSGAFPDLKDLTDNNIGYSTHFTCFPTSASIQSLIPNNCFGWNTSFVLVIRDGRFDNTNDFKAWLADQYAAGTPVIIVYPLATETTDTVTGQPMNTTAGDNILEITQASLDGLELEAKYKKSA